MRCSTHRRRRETGFQNSSPKAGQEPVPVLLQRQDGSARVRPMIEKKRNSGSDQPWPQGCREQRIMNPPPRAIGTTHQIMGPKDTESRCVLDSAPLHQDPRPGLFTSKRRQLIGRSGSNQIHVAAQGAPHEPAEHLSGTHLYESVGAVLLHEPERLRPPDRREKLVD